MSRHILRHLVSIAYCSCLAVWLGGAGLASGQDDVAPEGVTPAPETSPDAGSQIRMPVRVIAERLVVRCEVSTVHRRIPGNFFVDYDRQCGLELHNRAAHGLKVDLGGGIPVKIHLPGSDIVVERREHGDEESLEEFTRLYSRELGETPCIGSIGAKILELYHVSFDLQAGFIYLTPPREKNDGPPAEEEGTTVTAIELRNELVWFPVRLPDHDLKWVSLGTSRYDCIVDEELCEDLGHPAGDIGAVTLKSIDLSDYVAFRPEELIQVHADGALGTIGLNLLEHFRVDVDRINKSIRFEQTVPADFPTADLAFFRARAEEEADPLVAYLDEHPDSRLAREAASLLLNLRLDERAPVEDFQLALEWMDKTRIEDLRATEALTTMKTLLESRRPDVAVAAGEIGVKSGRKDRYPESVHKLHSKLGELLLEQGEGKEAWKNLLSAAFGLPDDGHVNLNLGRYYEQEGRLERAMSRYIQAIIAPESGPQAVAGLERVQQKLGGEPLSVDLVDKLVSGKVYNFSAATKFEETEKTRTNRVVLAELFTNPHFGRPLREGWRSFAVGGAMAAEGLLSHFPPERLAVLSYHVDVPEPTALMNPLCAHLAVAYPIDGPLYFRINGLQTGPGAARARQAERAYNENRALVLAELEKPSPYDMTGEVRVEGGVVMGSVTVTGVQPPEEEEHRVHVVLAERGVLYPGKAKVVVHRMVARAPLTDDVTGVRYVAEDGGMKIVFSKSLAEVTAENEKFLDAYEAAGGNAATRLSTKIDPRQVIVVAYVRDRLSMEVLQAVRIDPASSEGEGIR